MQDTNKPLMLTITRTSERVGLSAYILRKWALNGTIRAIRVGNKIFINNNSLDEYLNNNSLTDTVKDQSGNIYQIPAKIMEVIR